MILIKKKRYHISSVLIFLTDFKDRLRNNGYYIKYKAFDFHGEIYEIKKGGNVIIRNFPIIVFNDLETIKFFSHSKDARVEKALFKMEELIYKMNIVGIASR